MVEFLASVIGALAADALSKAGDVGGRVVADAYDALRALIVRKLGKEGAVNAGSLSITCRGRARIP